MDRSYSSLSKTSLPNYHLPSSPENYQKYKGSWQRNKDGGSPFSLCLQLPGAGAASAFMKATYPALDQNPRALS